MADEPVSSAAPSSQQAGGVADLHPGYFAMVMATGIISIASLLLDLPVLPVALFWMNLVFYAVLLALNGYRLMRYRDKVVADFLHHGRCVGFFTAVAATCVLGSQFLIVGKVWAAAFVLWIFGIVLWFGLTYGIFTILTVKVNKPTLADGINGGWLVVVVAAQAVSVLGSQLSPGLAPYEPQALMFCLALWLGGGMLYIWIISLVFYRYTFFALSPSDLAPPYWINMGAMAISALAGTMLIAAAPNWPPLIELVPFMKGLTLLFWSTATWWIPMLLILGIWRHVFRGFPLRYDPLYWGAVFPLGMYTACTYRLSSVLDAPFLGAIPRVFIYIALTAWGVTFAGFLKGFLHRKQ